MELESGLVSVRRLVHVVLEVVRHDLEVVAEFLVGIREHERDPVLLGVLRSKIQSEAA